MNITRKIREKLHTEFDVSKVQPGKYPVSHVVDVGHGCSVGIGTDDGCFVVLFPGSGTWEIGTHIPVEVAEKLGELAKAYKAENRYV